MSHKPCYIKREVLAHANKMQAEAIVELRAKLDWYGESESVRVTEERRAREAAEARVAALEKERDEWRLMRDGAIKYQGEKIAALTAEVAKLTEMVARARAIVARIGEGHNPHRKCLAPTKCCPENRLCFPCIANDYLALTAPAVEPTKPCAHDFNGGDTCVKCDGHKDAIEFWEDPPAPAKAEPAKEKP